jgi:hypothetical protein
MQLCAHILLEPVPDRVEQVRIGPGFAVDARQRGRQALGDAGAELVHVALDV